MPRMSHLPQTRQVPLHWLSEAEEEAEIFNSAWED
jgi:hypothetical protein